MTSTSEIAYARIHPGVGIARVGPSDEYVIGPELPYSTAIDPTTGDAVGPDNYRDGRGRIKRQGARFRVYGYDAEGNVVREITDAEADIRWTVHVANTKAAWYEFNVALDNPAAVPCLRRNASWHSERRRTLEIDPGPVSIAGTNDSVEIPTVDFAGSTDCTVQLGSLRTDGHGRLVVLGGFGKAGTPVADNDPIVIDNNYANAGRLWYDDVADGTVDASVVLRDGHRSITVEPSWVVTGPPNYAPDIVPIVNALDVVQNTYADANFGVGTWDNPQGQASFTQDIYPIFERLTSMQWVNYGFYVKFGRGAPMHFLEPATLARLASADPAEAEFRTQIFDMFRDPTYSSMQPLAWPPVYGDNMAIPATTPDAWLALTETQYGLLQQWSVGNFIEDWAGAPPAQLLDNLPASEQPDAADQGPLFYCMGGPFHPGGVLPFIIRQKSMWTSPFRVRRRSAGEPEYDYGHTLSVEEANSPSGPMFQQSPGDITRWQAIPWHVDVSGCADGYTRSFDAYLPSFWPARVPNEMLSQASYEVVMDDSASPADRATAFSTRQSWLTGIPNRRQQAIAADMIDSFGARSVIRPMPGPGGDFPDQLWVADLGGGSMSDHYRTLVAELYRAFVEGDIPAFVGSLSSDVVWTILGPQGTPAVGTYHGVAGVQAWMQNEQRVITTTEFVPPPPSQFVIDGTTVTANGTERGILSDPPHTPYTGTWSHRFSFSGDLVTEFTEVLEIHMTGSSDAPGAT